MCDISIIIPTYNRATRLQACLGALAQQAAPGSAFEVIVVVDGSTDDTRRMLDQLSVPFPLRVIWQPNQGQHIARNRGAETACGRHLLFLDDDIVAGPALVAEHVRVQDSADRTVGIGQLELSIPPTADWFMRQFAEGWRQHYDGLNRSERLPTWADCYGGNLSVARATFLAVGGFAEDVRRSHDIELGFRLSEHGAAFVYIPNAVGYQDERKGIRDMAGDFRAAGRAYVSLGRRHPAMLPTLLGAVADTNLRLTMFRHALRVAHVPPRLLGWIGSLFGSTPRAARWFHFVQTFFYWSGARQASVDGTEWHRLMRRVPILMYHAFGDTERASRYVMPARRFAQQMTWLRRMGYRVIGLEELLRHRREFRMPQARSVVITIDDAYRDTVSHAYPVLRRHRIPATVFVVSDRVGGANTWSDGNGLQGRGLMTWEQIVQLMKDGIEIGAHTGTHPRLPQLTRDEIQHEMVGSKRTLEERLRLPIRTFAYPYGEYDATCEQVAEQTGFWCACGVEPGLNTLGTPLYALRRVEIDGTLSLFRFMLAVVVGDTGVRTR